MRVRVQSLVLGVSCVSAALSAQSLSNAPEVAAPLSRAAAISEIQVCVSELEQVHPNLYFATSRASFKQLERNLLQHLPKTPTQIDVYLVLSRLIGTLEDGHIGVGRLLQFRKQFRHLRSGAKTFGIFTSQQARVFSLFPSRSIKVG